MYHVYVHIYMYMYIYYVYTCQLKELSYGFHSILRNA